MQEPIGDQKRCSEFRKYIIKLRDQLIAEGIESLRAVKCNNTNLCDTVRETSSNPFSEHALSCFDARIILYCLPVALGA
jgi:hypothetical protein